mgnify:FL=1
MKYPDRWKKRIKISNPIGDYGRVTFDGRRIGKATSRHSPGAKTSKGMQTDVVWEPVTDSGEKLPDTSTQTEAVDALIAAAGVTL